VRLLEARSRLSELRVYQGASVGTMRGDERNDKRRALQRVKGKRTTVLIDELREAGRICGLGERERCQDGERARPYATEHR
jgi:hypothetical protein